MNHEYRNEYRQIEREAIWTGWRIIFAIIILSVIGTAAKFIFWPVRMAGKTLDGAERVIEKELMPEALNQKYNWLKEQASAIRAQKAKIDLLRGNFTTAMARAEGRQLSRTAEERLFTQEQDLQNTILAYNTLVGSYNGEMSKWHTAFVNVGAMPQGWQDVAPAKFPEYINQ